MEDTDLIFNDSKESVFYLGGIMFCGSVSKWGDPSFRGNAGIATGAKLCSPRCVSDSSGVGWGEPRGARVDRFELFGGDLGIHLFPSSLYSCKRLMFSTKKNKKKSRLLSPHSRPTASESCQGVGWA